MSRANRLSKKLVEHGAIVVSGMAEGIDMAAHKAAIRANGRTIAVLGTPLDKFYPKSNAELQREVMEHHAALSQFPVGYPTTPRNFPMRNALMALDRERLGDRRGRRNQRRLVAGLGNAPARPAAVHHGFGVFRSPPALAARNAQYMGRNDYPTKTSTPSSMCCRRDGSAPMPLLSEIAFGSYLVYSPSGKSAKSVSAKNVCYAVKQDLTLQVGKPPQPRKAILFLAEHLKLRLADSPLAELFRHRPLLVPAPRSSPLKPDSLSPTRLICRNLVQQGLGSEMAELLRRTQAVPKAAFQKPADRPTISQHYDSLEVTEALAAADHILVVDDVVTSGGMLLACVSRLQETFPHATVAAFALIRTMSGEEIEQVVMPCTGTIRLLGDRGRRTP